MCMSRSVSTPKVDPAPTAVQAADVQADTGNKERRERRRGGWQSTMLSDDRNTILGSLTGGRDKLG